MTETTKYADEVTNGDHIYTEDGPAIVTDVSEVPLTEDDLYAPATPGRLTIGVVFDDNTEEEYTMWETDIVAYV